MINVTGNMVRMHIEDLQKIYRNMSESESVKSTLMNQIHEMEDHIQKIEQALEKTWRENRSLLGQAE